MGVVLVVRESELQEFFIFKRLPRRRSGCQTPGSGRVRQGVACADRVLPGQSPAEAAPVRRRSKVLAERRQRAEGEFHIS